MQSSAVLTRPPPPPPLQRSSADKLLTAFREHPDAWTRVDTILESSGSPQTKYLALQTLESVIKYRWKTLPPEQREGIKTYLVQKIITLSQDERTLRSESVLVNKLNLLLVGVLTHEWPAGWRSFIPDIVGSSKTSEVLCENNVVILRLLSEEVFDFSKESMTARRAASLKASLTTEFAQIHGLFDFILTASKKVSLVNATLQTLQRYVTWVPDAYIFEPRFLDRLCSVFLPTPAFRINALMVLSEVGSLSKPPEFDRQFENLYVNVMAQLVRFIPADMAIKRAYESGSSEDQTFIRHLALFLTGFFKAHIELLEPEAMRSLLTAGLNYLVQISDINEPEVFKICLEFWLKLANDLYVGECAYAPMLPALGTPGGGAGGGFFLGGGTPNPRKAIYAEVLSRVREVMINHMAKPEEILIEEDDAGEIVRETTKDTDALATYRVMRDTLVYLTHLDPLDTETIMLDKLAKLMDGRELGWEPLNTLSWAIGSISGTMGEAEEKKFLVTVIKDLLGMCEAVRGKNNKAVVASNIMYVVGQYPRFLRSHWKFLHTVVLKLFEFMHEKHPGVQDMAVDTFLKIAQKCRKKFVALQAGDTTTFIEDLCDQLPMVLTDLEAHQVHTFYEAAGTMVSAHPEAEAREFLTERLMTLPNALWTKSMRAAAVSVDSLRSVDTLRDLQRVLRTNAAACRAIGPSFSRQLGRLYLDMLNVYKMLSGFITAAVAAQGETVLSSSGIKAMRVVKKDVLNLVSTFVSRTDDPKFVAAHFVPPLLPPVLTDYASSPPGARDPEVLTLMAEIVSALRSDVLSEAPVILSAVFEPTLSMITTNFQTFPEHRVAFFKLLEALNSHCFAAIMALPQASQKLIVDSVVWAFKHTGRDIDETGLSILGALLSNVATAGSDVAQPFYAAYLLTLTAELMGVLTDRLHKSSFKTHAQLLRHICGLVESGAVSVPLWETPAAAACGAAAAFSAKVSAVTAASGGVTPAGLLSNQQFMREYVRVIISSGFPNLAPCVRGWGAEGEASPDPHLVISPPLPLPPSHSPVVSAFVEGLFDTSKDQKAYKSLCRDFLIVALEFGGDDVDEEERAAAEAARRSAVPGLVPPSAVVDDDL